MRGGQVKSAVSGYFSYAAASVATPAAGIKNAHVAKNYGMERMRLSETLRKGIFYSAKHETLQLDESAQLAEVRWLTGEGASKLVEFSQVDRWHGMHINKKWGRPYHRIVTVMSTTPPDKAEPGIEVDFAFPVPEMAKSFYRNFVWGEAADEQAPPPSKDFDYSTLRPKLPEDQVRQQAIVPAAAKAATRKIGEAASGVASKVAKRISERRDGLIGEGGVKQILRSKSRPLPDSSTMGSSLTARTTVKVCNGSIELKGDREATYDYLEAKAHGTTEMLRTFNPTEQNVSKEDCRQMRGLVEKILDIDLQAYNVDDEVLEDDPDYDPREDIGQSIEQIDEVREAIKGMYNEKHPAPFDRMLDRLDGLLEGSKIKLEAMRDMRPSQAPKG